MYNKDDLKIIISLPKRMGSDRLIDLLRDDFHFHVIVINISNKTQRLWEPGNSWGEDNLSFEIADDKGNILDELKRKPQVWKKNAPNYSEIEPGEHYIIDVFLKREWELSFLEKINESNFLLKLRAIYKIEEDNFSKEHGIWTGQVKSEFDTYRVIK